MQSNTILRTLAATVVAATLAACTDQAGAPTAPNDVEMPQRASAGVASLQHLPDPFTIRAPLDAFFINQPSEMMIRSNARTDFVMQRLVTAPGPGGWHTHPGPSFGIVEEGQVMITRYTKKGCVSTTYGPGDAYFEVAGEVHRATVVGDVTAVEYKARFYTPVGGPFGNPAADPGCG
ncbi:MAG TPA: cupin domain-containing protein [Longimicrobiales bacterium]